MEVINTIRAIQSKVEALKNQGNSVGFVPTMGALHSGHLSLVKASKSENSITIVSIFVNPTQFNDKEDLKKYPRTFEEDAEKLEKAGVDFIFFPEENEMYPEPDNRIFDFGNLDKVMEGAYRPGHFNGVAQIVSKLFDAVNPDRAYFGEKDFQQLAIIKNMVKQLNSQIKIVPCTIVRESDGLAMSSRNVLLNPKQRLSAALISQTLFKSKDLIKSKTLPELKLWVQSTIDTNPELKVEYFEIVDDTSLQPISKWEEDSDKIGCIAVKVGSVRLIDNIKYN